MATLADFRETTASAMTPAKPSTTFRLGGMSDRAIAWLFITPTVALLLAINIFPLLWTVYMSFTNYKANMGWVKYRTVGIDNYVDLLTDPDIWAAMQTTAHFVFWSILFEVLIGFGLALLINRKFRGHSLWTTVILLPMMLSPAVVGNFWTFLFQPQIGLFNYIVGFDLRRRSGLVPDDRRREARALDHRARGHLDVDPLRHADLSRRPAFHSGFDLRSCRSRPGIGVAQVLVDHAADGDAVPDAGRAVSRD